MIRAKHFYMTYANYSIATRTYKYPASNSFAALIGFAMLSWDVNEAAKLCDRREIDLHKG